jgi:2-polyprenyl-6-methoxyphenol hydroxylase-like FAD-dependent oxidoreductase
VRVLDKMGLGPAFREQSLPVHTTNILDGNGKIIAHIPFTPLQKYGLTATVERTVLHTLLTDSLKKVRVCMGTSIEKIEEAKGKVKVKLSGGIDEEFDLVIAADGMRSSLRSMVFSEPALRPYYWHLWVFWMSSEISLPTGISQSLSTKGAVYFFPTHQGRTAAGILKKSNSRIKYATRVDKKELLRHTSDMGPWISNIVTSLPEVFECYQDELMYVRMKKWFEGRIIFIGDAQHGVSLASGLGASLALEDAYTLAEELGKVQVTDDIELALQCFAARRISALNFALPWIRHAERLAMTSSIVLAWLRNKILKLFPGWATAPLEAYLKRGF